MITLRLDPALEQAINNTAKTLDVTKSELVRRSILEYLGKLSKSNAWEVAGTYLANTQVALAICQPKGKRL